MTQYTNATETEYRLTTLNGVARWEAIVITSNGPVLDECSQTLSWYNSDGELHREDGPARISADGKEEWFEHGKRHREDGPAIEYTDGYKEYRLHGKPRDWKNGPAVTAPPTWSMGIYPNGLVRYWCEGKLVSEERLAEIKDSLPS